MVRAVIFDLDDTLLVDMKAVEATFEGTAALAADRDVDVPKLAVSAREEARRIWRAAPTVETAQALGIASWEGLCSEFVGGHPVVEPFRVWAPEYRLAAWRAALSLHGIDDDELARALAGHFIGERRRHFRLYEGAAELVASLRAEGLVVGLLTNGPPDLQRAKIRLTAIEDAFDEVVISGEVGWGKPSPEVFHFALEQLGVAAAETVMVGDNPRRDVAASRALGMRAIWIDQHDLGRPEGMEADAEVSDVREVAAIVAAWA